MSCPAYLTTSWDDGGEHDRRLAETLHQHGVRGTLYWSSNAEDWPLLGSSAIGELIDLGMEIGSHGITHADLTRVDDATLQHEVSESRRQLEEHCGAPIRSFCYPFGRFDRRCPGAVARAGYAVARTNVSFHDGGRFDPFLMPVTFQLYPHGRRQHVTHAIRKGNAGGLWRWLVRYGAETKPLELARLAVEHVRRAGGILHIWGHAWEIEQQDMWGLLDSVLAEVAGFEDVLYVTNGQLAP